MAAEIKLIVFDLDDTLIGKDDEFELYDAFAAKMAYYKEHYGTKWAVCTGRSHSGFIDCFSPMQISDIIPDYIILKHSSIWRHTCLGYRPRISWNFMIRYRLWSNKLYVKEALNQWAQVVLNLSRHVKIIYHRKNKLCMRFKSEESAIAIQEMLEEKANPYNHIKIFRTMNEVDVRMVPFSKGLAVSELAERLGISWSNILAVGDGHSDLSMLDGEAAHFTGCPGNAEIDVMSQVNKSGGHIAKKRVLAGVLEILDAYLQDDISSNLPEWWTPALNIKGQRLKGSMIHSPRKKKRHVSTQKITGWVVALAAYVTLTVFASFGLIPFVSGLIMKPFVWMTRIVEWLIDFFVSL